ncbi:MAG: FKBP-type peptidyl-prolyl cis-trans isomerase [Bacteroidales bacterium]|nr:FKBP-type peptidyl-prolyl cis-trans isomerase [Bacteroidales bacterium]
MLKVQTKEEHQAELEKAKREQEAKEEKNKIESQRFLEQNSKKEGVITLPSGLQYKIITMGTGERPGPTDMVTVHYKGTLINGTVFDSSIERGQPASFRVNGVIRGWTEALQLMPVGSKWTLYIPSDLAYKNQQRGQYIGPNMALIFDVELLGISKE